MAHDYEIGTTGPGLTNLADLTPVVPEPKSNFLDNSQYITLGDGSVRGLGWLAAEWRWTFLTRAQRDELKTFCAGASATAYIRTRTNDTIDAYEYYSGTMIWPQRPEKSYSKRMDFVIRFINLEVYTP